MTMRVLYVGHLGPRSSALFRRWAISRLGHEVVDLDTSPYLSRGNWLERGIRMRILVGGAIRECNRDILAVAERERPDVIWFDKAVLVQAKTVRRLRESGFTTLHYNIDNPFGPRKDPGWRLVLGAVPEYDLHLVQRDCNLADYRNAGARDVFMLRTAYEPTMHFPPPTEWSDADRLHDVVFIGHAYDQRAQFITELWQRHGIPVKVWGEVWPSVLPGDMSKKLWQGPAIYNELYREAIWRSRICLSFVTHSNCDDVAHKSFEIAACGSFLLAEDTEGHRAHFKADEEAVFFASVEECAAKIRRYLPDMEARDCIGAAARQRCEASGYSYDARIERVFAHIASTRGRHSQS
jgi:spore maturation protein CgeB